MTSHRRAITTIPVAQRATVTARLVRSPRRAGKEDHPVGGARDLLERADHLGLPAAALGLHGDRGPPSLLGLAAELRDDPLLVLAALDVAPGDQLPSVAA